jgi:hypothetical protein
MSHVQVSSRGGKQAHGSRAQGQEKLDQCV